MPRKGGEGVGRARASTLDRARGSASSFNFSTIACSQWLLAGACRAAQRVACNIDPDFTHLKRTFFPI